MKKILTQILAILVLTFTSFTVHSEENCEPEFELNKSVLNQAIAKDEEKGEVFVFFDQSTTMQGFTIDQPGQNNQYVNIVDDIQQVAENIGTDTIYQKFGSEINTMSDKDVAKVKTPKFYECSGSAVSCNNQFSSIKEIFAIAEDVPEATHIVITHLALQDSQLLASDREAITGPLISILKQGKSIGIIGVMNSFNGKIDNIPLRSGEYTDYVDAESRPFYVLVIGNQNSLCGLCFEII